MRLPCRTRRVAPDCHQTLCRLCCCMPLHSSTCGKHLPLASPLVPPAAVAAFAAAHAITLCPLRLPLLLTSQQPPGCFAFHHQAHKVHACRCTSCCCSPAALLLLFTAAHVGTACRLLCPLLLTCPSTPAPLSLWPPGAYGPLG